MTRYLVRRVIVSVVMIIGTSVLIFGALRILPGNPILTRFGANSGVTAADIAKIERQLGFDHPLVVQYWNWIAGVFHGNFGKSYFSQFSVTTLIAQRIPPTLELTVGSILICLLISVPAAILSAVRPGRSFDRVSSMFASFALALPAFVTGIMFLLIFSVHNRLLPAGGYAPLSKGVWPNIRLMILPACTLAIAQMPLVFRFLRGQLVEELSASYVRTAQGKGAPRMRVVVRHALRNALIPGLTMLGLVTGYALGGVVVVEYVFGMGGLGSLAVTAANQRDYAVLQGTVLLISTTFIIVSLVVDLTCQFLDPRLRTQPL
ncbi:MAG TPA: ABC transporter permease [Acidimicrobiales bacterium]|nr:ABC transporter permease [Acidimicrobiales bacterium]